MRCPAYLLALHRCQRFLAQPLAFVKERLAHERRIAMTPGKRSEARGGVISTLSNARLDGLTKIKR